MVRRGRLAPSPTGRLHLGNLSSCLLAWVQARQVGGHLWLRIEDTDRARSLSDSVVTLCEDLRWVGIDWDEGPRDPQRPDRHFQSQRTELYEDALRHLSERGLLFACTCSRRDVEEALSAPHAPYPATLRYPGTCRDTVLNGLERLPPGVALRLRCEGIVTCVDGCLGVLRADLAADPGDIVLRRRDGLFAYNLAVVVDDLHGEVSDIVRGADLFHVTPVQHHLARCLGGAPPATLHVPLLHDAQGTRLAKRHASAGRPALTEQGWTPELLRGALLWLWGIRDRCESASLDDLLAETAIDRLPRDAIRVPDALWQGPHVLARVAAGHADRAR